MCINESTSINGEMWVVMNDSGQWEGTEEYNKRHVKSRQQRILSERSSLSKALEQESTWLIW